MTPPDPDRPEPWSLARLIGFRFAFIYLLLYGVPATVSEVPLLSWLVSRYLAVWSWLVSRLGGALLGMDVPYRVENGSGDQLFSYVELVVLVLVAGVGTLVWSLADRKRPAYRQLAEVLRIYLRFLLAFTMLLYGMVKILKSQFPEPTPGRLLIPIGQSSPMGLLWTFMGQSTAYTLFAGLAELTGGALLLFRRTTSLGALVLLGVLGHVVVLNYCYDVPVKLYSTHLLLIAALLLWPDARRVIDFLILNRATAPADLGEPPGWARWQRQLRITKVLVVTAMVTYIGWLSFDSYKKFGDGAAKSPLHGAYQVLAMERAGAAVAPAEPSGWRQVALSRVSLLAVTGDGVIRRYGASYDPEQHILALTDREDPQRAGRLTVTPAGAELRLVGDLGGVAFSLRLRKMEESEFLLVSRGFHWVNDFPFNR